ncbi:SDR family NAD(P)-dependent oxidoreductase [Thermoflavimicrobium dichotomicum]|uniref:NAD(P)-dependent dehydrogenase, short-chain alcohol dehydrogenase family n=1 Tax=Thermoflavimicrobium dichotomicum TaxID=46223 RepID=A0A1I3MDN6_9BACL|nr:SDR family oxidoreductase [Thermoflavimicrobium dichotomicum]SFI94806.1 NAD(P)-dependent dehydrogenase, short-chain alcohol dehydrogenase family [Thermoflavimicrobium dichotomicum]
MDKVVMITGASRGLGKALALAFAKEGYQLAISARGEEALMKVKDEAEKLGVKVLAVAGDMSIAEDVERFVGTAEVEFGRIDVLINNASIFGPSPGPYLLDYPEEDFVEVLRVNTVGPFLVTRRVLGHMLTRETGSIINVTSEAGNIGYAGWGAYGISKFALEGMTQTWADEVDGTGVRVNMVDPGEMDTEMHRQAVPNCDYELADPNQVVDVFLYLASDQSKHINGMRFKAQDFVKEGQQG